MTKSPLDIPFGEHAAIIGKGRSGKTTVAKSAAEKWMADGDRLCVIDPTDTWWGLRLMPDGKKPSNFPIIIFGGDHADLPLHATSGIALADIVAHTSSPVIICTQQMTMGEQTRFSIDFFEALFRMNRGPLRVVIDEAHLFLPQGKVMDPQSSKMFHAASKLVALGGGRGFSVVMITQRPQKLHKDSMTQAETLVAMRLPAPQDRDAVKDWIGEWGNRTEAAAVLSSLPMLPTGEGWIYSGIRQQLKRTKFPPVTTYDSGYWRAEESPTLTPIDIAAIQSKLETMQVDVALDGGVKELKARIKELEHQLKEPRIDRAAIAAEHLRAGTIAGAKGLIALVQEHLSVNDIVLPRLTQIINDRLAELEARAIEQSLDSTGESFDQFVTAPRAKPSPDMQRRIKRDAESMGAAESKLLIAIIQFPGSSIKKIAIIAGYSPTSGGVAGALGLLRRRGFIEHGVPLLPTNAGVTAAGEFDPLPIGKALVTYWLGRLDSAPRNILTAVLAAGKAGIDKNQAAKNSGYSPTSGGVAGAIGELRSLGLIEGTGKQPLRASPHLFGG